MDDFPGLLARDFGFKQQGKSAPMASSRNNNSSFGVGSSASEFSKPSSLNSTAVVDDHDRDGLLYNDVFGGPPKYSSTSAADSRSGNTSSFDYESIFKDQKNLNSGSSKANSMPVYDKPVYDDDIFEGLPGLRSSSTPAPGASSSSVKFDDVFVSISTSSSAFDDLLGNLGKKETESRVESEKNATAFDDLLPGFGLSSPYSGNRTTSESSRSQKPPSNLTKTSSSVLENPFVVLESTSTPMGSSLEVLIDPPEEIGKFNGSGNAKVNGLSVSGGVFDNLDPLNSLGKSVPPVSPEIKVRENDRSPLRSKSMSGTQTYPKKESIDRSSVENFESYPQNRTAVDSFQGPNETLFDMANSVTDSLGSSGRATSPPSYMSASLSETNSHVNTTAKPEEMFESADDVWLTVSEIPLFTQPTSAPPPSRPPPPRPTQISKLETANVRKKTDKYASFSNSPQYTHSPKSSRAGARNSAASQIDELEDFAMGTSWKNVNEYGEVPSVEDVESSIAAASAAAMKEAMDRAEAKFRHAKEMRERESFKAARSRESFQLDEEERAMQQDAQERLDREMQQSEKEEEEQRRLERERERARESEREREEKEREQRRLEKERERAREINKEREKARLAVERATREARERAAAEARIKAERAAVDKANAAARERAGRAAVQRAQTEARERAAAEARERAERVAAEARERANAEAREKEARERAAVAKAEAEARQRAERAAVQRAATEARERAAAEARERASAAARVNQNQQKNENDLESFFSSQPSSAPGPRASTSDSMFDSQSRVPEPARRTSVGASSNMKKASSTTNIVGDLSSIFGAAGSAAGEFQEVEGETEERRRARLERHQRTQERAAKALAEKNQRDLQAQWDQAERHRIAETLDVEIKRWAAGKEGNIRALLATLQYVLWPECGWQPISLTDLITAAAVKKVYRKATLCIHPDKVQQKGANLQQKYIAEKVFDLLKEAWNKFNSEELF